MGCDIHDYVEVKKNGVWEKVGAIFPYPYFHPEEPKNQLKCWVDKKMIPNYHPDHNLPCNQECWTENQEFCDHPYMNRNYSLFAILADVRNGRGYAGCDTGDGFVPIAKPRGLPNNVSEEVKSLSDRYGCDGHSHSWFLLSELEAYNWDQETKRRGYVSAEEYKIFKETGEPESWCGGIGGGNTRVVPNIEMDYLINHKPNKLDGCYTQIEWGVTYRNQAGAFLTKTMPKLKELGQPDEVRIVFWFDN